MRAFAPVYVGAASLLVVLAALFAIGGMQEGGPSGLFELPKRADNGSGSPLRALGNKLGEAKASPSPGASATPSPTPVEADTTPSPSPPPVTAPPTTAPPAATAPAPANPAPQAGAGAPSPAPG